jgi:hypothetical protein
MSSERNYRDIGEFEGDGDHWISVGEASARLLALLEKHHKRETAPTRPSRSAVSTEGGGSGEQAHGPRSNALAGSIPAVSTNQRNPARSNADDRQ